MEILQIILMVFAFVGITLSMFYRVLPAILALPILAILIALIGGVSPVHVIEYVLGKGPLKLSSAYTIAMFGGMLSVILQKTGVAESLIKKGAELSGDQPWVISVMMLILISLLFTTLGGLGAIIMVATIVLPVLSAVGVGAMTAVGIFLFGVSIGGTLNVGNWALYKSVMELSVDQIRPFALIIFSLLFASALVYITLQLYFDGHALNLRRIALRGLFTLGLIAGGLLLWFYVFPAQTQSQILSVLGQVWSVFRYALLTAMLLLGLGVCLRAYHLRRSESDVIHWTAYLSPVLPLLLILVLNVNFIAAFILGLLYAFVSTYRKGRLNTLIQACVEGAGVVMPAVLLMFGIGMILVAIMGPGGDAWKEFYPNGWPVLNLIQPVTQKLIPTQPVLYVIVFTLAAPMALYRGPLNLWGMGFGLATVFLAAGLPPAAVMGLLMSVGQIQGISDPTNTQNVWLASEMRVDVQKVMWNTLPYAWGVACIGLCVSAMLFMRGGV